MSDTDRNDEAVRKSAKRNRRRFSESAAAIQRASSATVNLSAGRHMPTRSTSTEMYQSRMGRRGSILEQANAQTSQYSRNSIKKQVLQKMTRSLSVFSVDEDDLSSLSFNNGLKKVMKSNGGSLTDLSTAETSVDDSIKSATVKKSISMNRRQLLASVENIVSGTVATSPSELPDKGGAVPKTSSRRTRQLKLQRSFTVDSFVAQAPTPRKVTIKMPKPKGLLFSHDVKKEAKKKDLKKMWCDTYTGMCNRAVVLNHVIDQADQQEVEVKPLNSFKDVSETLINQKRNARKKNEDKIFIGLSNPFYHVSHDDEVSSSTEEMSVIHAASAVSSSPGVTVPDVMTADIKEVRLTEEVLLKPTNTWKAASVRLNLRTRSVDAFFMSAKRKSNPSVKVSLPEVEPGPTSPIYSSKKSIVAALSPSNIPRLVTVVNDASRSLDNTGYLDRDYDPPKRKQHQLVINQHRHKSQSASAPLAPKTTQTLDSVRLLTKCLKYPQPKVDVGTQVNFPPPLLLNLSSRSESPESRPVERQIEARSGSEDGLGSMVRCLHFANTYIANRKSVQTALSSIRCSAEIIRMSRNT